MATTDQKILPQIQFSSSQFFSNSMLQPNTFFYCPSVDFSQSLLCHLLSSSKWESNEAETSTFISTLGYTSADYYCHLVKNVSILCNWEIVNNKSPVYMHIHGAFIVIRNMDWTLFIFSYLSHFYSLLREKMKWEISGQRRKFFIRLHCNRSS